MSADLSHLPPVCLPEALPGSLPQPKFQLGATVYWHDVPEPDFGRIVGMIYTHEATHQIAGLHYLVLLDAISPSRSICTHDFAFEADLALLDCSLGATGRGV